MSAIVVAGGAGERLGGPIPKQFQHIGGKPILYHAVAAFERCEAIQDIVLVAAEAWLAYVSQEIVDKFALTKIPASGWTDKFIYPPYEFKLVDGLITNFHLPSSTLLMLVCAFAGRDFVFKAYRKAIREKYRFYSYGDAMLIV